MKKTAGFTFLEVLLAVMITALIAGGLYAGFAAGVKIQQRLRTAFLDVDESRMITERLRRDLGRLIFYDFKGSYPEKKSFWDAEDQLLMVILDDQDLRWVRYRIDAVSSDRVVQTIVGEKTQKNIAVTESSDTVLQRKMLVREEGDFSQMFSSGEDLAPERVDVLTRRIAPDGWKTTYASTIMTQGRIEWAAGWEEDFLPAAMRVELFLERAQGEPLRIEGEFLIPTGGRNEV